MQGTDLTWWSPFLFLFWRCIPQLDFLQPGCDKETQLLQNLPRAELSAFKIHFLVTISLAATTSVSSDNSSFLQGHIKLLQGRLFYVLFLMPLCTSFMSKKIICHIQFLQHYSDKNQSLRKSLMSEASSKQSNKYCSSQLVFRVLVVLPEISLTPSTLCCQKNFVCWSFSFLPLPFFFFFSLLPFSFSSLPKEMRGKYKWDTVPSLSLHHLQMVSFFWQFHMQPYKKTWLTSAANFKDVQSCAGPVCAGGADRKRLRLISVRISLCLKWGIGEKTFLPVVEFNPSSKWRQRKNYQPSAKWSKETLEVRNEPQNSPLHSAEKAMKALGSPANISMGFNTVLSSF